MVAKIPLTQGKVAIVDKEDYKRLAKYSWSYDSNGYAYRRKTIEPYKSVLVSMHREILEYIPKGKVVDHKNRNKLDNRKENLRITTQSYNAANSPPRKGTSKFKGVHWGNRYNKWIAKIEKEGKFYRLGHYDCEINAAIAYNKKALELFGEFAYLNNVNRTEIDWKLEKRAKESSDYVGVSKHKATGKFRSYLTHNKKQIHLGFFDDEEQAAKMRDLWYYDLNRDDRTLNIRGEVISYG